MKCLLVTGAVVALLFQVTAGRDLPFRRNSVAGKRQQLNSPFNLRQDRPGGYPGDSQENDGAAQPGGYYGPADGADEGAEDYSQYDGPAGSQEDGGAQGPQFGVQPPESAEDRPAGGQGGGAGGDDFNFADFQGFGRDSLPADIPMKFDGPLPELSDSESEKSNGFISGAPQGFPSLNDFGGFQGKFAEDAPQQASDEGQQQGGADAGADEDYGDDASPEYNSPAANGGARPGASSQYERQLGGAPSRFPGRPHAFFDSAPTRDISLQWAK